MTLLDFVIIGAMMLASLAGGGVISYIVMTHIQARKAEKTERTVDQSVEQPKVSQYWRAEATDDC